MAGAVGVWSVGETAEFPDDEAARLCEAGIAEPVPVEPEISTPASKEKRGK
jgi:hypothetical protein